MKKVFLTAMVAAAFCFGMTACNNNATEETTDSVVTEVAEECCAHECEHNCQDSVCAASNCENCTKKGTDECCKVKAGETEGCNHECEGNHEGCEHHCQHNN